MRIISIRDRFDSTTTASNAYLAVTNEDKKKRLQSLPSSIRIKILMIMILIIAETANF
jgi:hypothetical protein